MKIAKMTATAFYYTKRSGLQLGDVLAIREVTYKNNPENNHIEYTLADDDTLYWVTNDGSGCYYELSDEVPFFNIGRVDSYV